jgi:nucleotide-binding universal stress UspA family protein
MKRKSTSRNTTRARKRRPEPLQNVLVAVDGSDNSLRAVAWVADFFRSCGPVAIHLVNAQPSPQAWQTHGLGRRSVDEHLRFAADRTLEKSGAPLRRAAIPYQVVCAFGDAAEVIAKTAARLGCDAIVVGRRGLGSIRGMVLGSVSRRLLHLTGLPVVLVR